MTFRLLPFLLLFCLPLSAQPDAYHQALVEAFSVQFTLSGETYPYFDSELEYIRDAGSYGAARSSGAVDDQDFTRFTNLDVPAGLANAWDAAWSVANQEPIAQGDKLLWVIYLRAKPEADTDAEAQVNIFFELAGPPYTKEFLTTLTLNDEWTRYLIPVEVAEADYPAGRLNAGIHVGAREQELQIGGVAILNYGPDISLSQLPRILNEGNYGGFEEDAAWRAPAAERIDALRKADLDLTVIGTDGEPMVGADVAVRMQQHAFGFGTAIKGSRFPGGQDYNETFVRNIFDLDGEGHGFNTMVFENDLKWPAWEQQWVTTNEQMRRVIPYLYERGIQLRGHVLLWPGWGNLPGRMQENRNDADYLKQQVENHTTRMLETEDFDRWVKDWDVLNEINTNTDLAAALRGKPGYTTGREIYAETFEKARELAPDAELYINDYITMSLKNEAGNAIYDQYVNYIGEIVDAGVPIDGIGFQAHLNSPNSIYSVENTLDDFYDRFGLDAKITEFDMPRTVNKDVVGPYFRDFLTMNFSHPSMTGFVFWNWWDVDTWANPGANLYDAEWNEKPVHAAFVDLVFNEWWTEEDLSTDATGQAGLRGFKGTYEITLTCDGTEVSTSMTLGQDTAMTLDCNQLLTSTTLPPLPEGSVTAAPNPASGPIRIVNHLPMRLSATLLDVAGREVWRGVLPHGRTEVPATPLPGLYTLRFDDGQRAGALRIVKQ